MTALSLLNSLNPKTQNYQVLKRMMDTGYITVRDMYQMGINSPRDRIYQLKKYGIEIDAIEKVSVKGKKYKVYILH